MFIGCRVENQIGLVLRHDPTQGSQVFHIANQAYQLNMREALAEVLFNLVQREFAQLEQHQTAGAKTGNLTAQL